jgi:hypothetical protein
MSRQDLKALIEDLHAIKQRIATEEVAVKTVAADVELLRNVLARNLAAAEGEFKDRLNELEVQRYEMGATFSLALQSVTDAEKLIHRISEMMIEGTVASALKEHDIRRELADELVNHEGQASARLQEAEEFLRHATRLVFVIGAAMPLLKMVDK